MENHPGVWEYRVDVKRDLGIVGPKAYEELSQLSEYSFTNDDNIHSF